MKLPDIKLPLHELHPGDLKLVEAIVRDCAKVAAGFEAYGGLDIESAILARYGLEEKDND